MRLLPALILTLATASAQAAPLCFGPESLPEPRTEMPLVPNHFHRAEGRLACVLPKEAGDAIAAGSRPTSFLPCLRVGAVAVADSLRAVEALLGEPAAIQTIDWRTEARAYTIRQRSEPEPYYVVTYRDDVAVAVQLLGPFTEMPATFSGIALGDPMQKVIDILGRPARRCPITKGGPETWTWPPFPIGVDVYDGRVSGLKVTWPAGR